MLLATLSSFYNCGENADKPLPMNYKGYSILPIDKKDTRWADYLYKHLSKRTPNKSLFSKISQTGFLDIRVGTDAQLKTDYEIIRDKNSLKIIGNQDSKTLWLIYQLIAYISEHNNQVNTQDIPPSILEFGESKASNFAFEYLEPHYQPNLNYDYAGILGTNILEKDWGLWGHQLGKILKKDHKKNVYAEVNGKVTEDQICFSKPETHRYISNFILDQYGDGNTSSTHFLIMPNDNPKVCTCKECKALGNTSSNATPAVTWLISKLAQEFPKHFFFTSAYGSTLSPPQHPLPDNCGVMLSAIHLPFKAQLNTEDQNAFIHLYKEWQPKTSKIYVWDYGANFDDYLTPFPFATLFRERLKLFKELNIKGVFINGSGYDYSSFQETKTYVLANLMMNPDLNPEQLTERFLKKKFPTLAPFIENYIKSLEERTFRKNKNLNIYGNAQDAKHTYFDFPEFIEFHNSIAKLKTFSSEEEKIEWKKLMVALAFTQLKFMHENGIHPHHGYAKLEGSYIIPKKEVWNYLKHLETAKAFNIKFYSESEIPISEYIEQWQQFLKPHSLSNQLAKSDFKVASKETDSPFHILNDGALGFRSDYQLGWLVIPNSLEIVVEDPKLINSAKQMEIRFLTHQRHKLYPPESVEIYKDDKLYLKLLPEKIQPNNDYNLSLINTPIDWKNTKNIKIKINTIAKTKIALDEITIK